MTYRPVNEGLECIEIGNPNPMNYQ